MEKIDLKKQLKHLYSASVKKIALVEVPALNFLIIDGEGDPNTAKSFPNSVEVLYFVSYTAKFMVKKCPLAIDYGVLPLEGLWWTDDMGQFTSGNKDIWKWTVLIMQP